MNMISSRMEAATKFLNNYIPKGRDYKFPGELGLAREVYLLKLLGEPQNKLKVIHIAGTSGKGSTAYFTSVILASLGFKVGLTVSPTLLNVRERFQINNTMISEEEFCKYLDDIIPFVKEVEKTKYGAPTHFEIMIALTYYIFFMKKVDYAVIETGLGGLLDGTNVVTRKDKVAVITKIGHDHTSILGNTLDKIAFQKAGIIHPGNSVITTNQYVGAMNVIKEVALKNKSDFNLVDKSCIKNVSLVPTPKFSLKYQNVEIKDVVLGSLGSFQIQNCSLSLVTGMLLAKRDKFIFDTQKIKKALEKAMFKGRMHKVVINEQTLILDGAHNPQKMRALVKDLKLYFPNRKFVFLVSLKRGKNYKSILRIVISVAKKIIIAPFANQTKAQGFSAMAEDTKRIAEIFKSLKFENYTICGHSKDALKILFTYKKEVGVITGSFYLLSEIYPIISPLIGKEENIHI